MTLRLAEKDPKILEEFSHRKKRQLIVSFGVVLPIFIGLITMKAGKYRLDILGLAFEKVALGIVVVALIFSFWNWRCPSCKRYLGKRLSPQYCDGCGTQLKE